MILLEKNSILFINSIYLKISIVLYSALLATPMTTVAQQNEQI